MERIKDMKQLAIDMFRAQRLLDDEKLREWEEEEIKDELRRVRDEIFTKGYDIYMIMHYIEEYKEVKIGGRQEWLNRPF
jgi:hypothetical protein